MRELLHLPANYLRSANPHRLDKLLVERPHVGKLCLYLLAGRSPLKVFEPTRQGGRPMRRRASVQATDIGRRSLKLMWVAKENSAGRRGSMENMLNERTSERVVLTDMDTRNS